MLSENNNSKISMYSYSIYNVFVTNFTIKTNTNNCCLKKSLNDMGLK